MTHYFPFQKRQSLIEKCLALAFKETWQEKDNDIHAEAARIDLQAAEPVFAYETFDLPKINQSFVVPESNAFSRSVLLWKNMYDISKDNFSTEESPTVKIKPDRYSFNTGLFDVSQVGTKMSLRQVIKMIHSLFTDNQDLLYGVLLHDGKRFFNPLHPINAQALVRKYSLEKYKQNEGQLDEEIYKVMIYTYRQKFDQMNKVLVDDSMNAIFTTHLLTVLSMLELKSQFGTKITHIDTLSEILGTNNYNDREAWTYSKFQYRTETVRTSDAVTAVQGIHIQPVQLINSGIASPYYGIVAEKYSSQNRTLGYQLSPMLSCNLGLAYTHINRNGEIEVPGVSVCTGGTSNTSEAGRLTLNHANLGSPYFSDTLTQGSFQFANISIRMALGIYSEFFDLPKIDIMVTLPPKPPISFDEFKRNNPNARFSDYIQAIKR